MADLPTTNPSHLPVTSKEGGYITDLIDQFIRALLVKVKSSFHRLAYGTPATMGSDNHFTYDPIAGRWRPREGSDLEASPHLSPLGDALSPPRTPRSHANHPYCSRGSLNQITEPTPFEGVFRRAPAETNTARFEIDLSSLVHPVYAPQGTVLVEHSPRSQMVPSPAPTRVIKTSPFS